MIARARDIDRLWKNIPGSETAEQRTDGMNSFTLFDAVIEDATKPRFFTS
jgi:hypothetical protein